MASKALVLYDSMGDNGHSGGADDELTLPRATVAKLINGKTEVASSVAFGYGRYATRRLTHCSYFIWLWDAKKDVLPDDMQCARETRDLIIECCIEFIHLVSSQANEICDKESRKTISPEHIMTALEQLEFNHFIPEIKEVFEEHRTQAKEREKKVSKFEETGLTEEELYAQQQELFAKSKAAFAAQGSVAGPSTSAS